MEYQVELPVYHGPMDLLLYLIKRDELDIYDIPIARITESYIKYVPIMKELSRSGELDINLAGDFLVMAATLMEIKSATLLPKPAALPGIENSATADITDPRYELVQKLLEYKRFKDSAAMLDRQHRDHEARFPRDPARLDGASDEPPPIDLEEVQVWDLLDAFSRLMKEVGVRKGRFHEVTYDDTPIDLHAADIEDRLKREGPLTLAKLVEGRSSRSEMIGLFLALLELVRQKKVLAIQSQMLGEVEISRAPEEHRKQNSEASLTLATETPAEGNTEIALAEVTAEG